MVGVVEEEEDQDVKVKIFVNLTTFLYLMKLLKTFNTRRNSRRIHDDGFSLKIDLYFKLIKISIKTNLYFVLKLKKIWNVLLRL